MAALDDRVTWTREVVGDVAMITVETEANGVWLEYYAPLDMSGKTTRFTFAWPGEVAVGGLSYDVKHPLGALNVQVTPAGETFTAEDGFQHTRTELGAFSSSQTGMIEMSYERPARPDIRPAVPYAGSLAFDRLDVGIWPEYDRREALVILEGTLPADIPLPAKIALPIPPSAGDPFAVAQVGQGGQLLVASYEREIIGDWAWVVVESESSVVQVEYYTPLTFDGQLRSFSYYWPGGVALGQLTYGIQHPAGAANMLVLHRGRSPWSKMASLTPAPAWVLTARKTARSFPSSTARRAIRSRSIPLRHPSTGRIQPLAAPRSSPPSCFPGSWESSAAC